MPFLRWKVHTVASSLDSHLLGHVRLELAGHVVELHQAVEDGLYDLDTLRLESLGRLDERRADPSSYTSVPPSTGFSPATVVSVPSSPPPQPATARTIPTTTITSTRPNHVRLCSFKIFPP